MTKKLLKSAIGKLAMAVVFATVGSVGVSAAGAPEDSSAEKSPHFILQGSRVLTINTRTLESRDTPDSTLFEISGGQFYITPSNKARYLYGQVREEEHNRLVAEHFTILISTDSLAVTLVQSDETNIRVTKTTVLSRAK